MIRQSHSWALIWTKLNSKRYMHPNVYKSTVYNTVAQHMETTCMCIYKWMDKEEVVHTHNGIVLSQKKERNNAICSNMDGPRECHTEWSMSDRERNTI